MEKLFNWLFVAEWDSLHFYVSFIGISVLYMILSSIFRQFGKKQVTLDLSIIAFIAGVSSLVAMFFFASLTLSFIILSVLTVVSVVISLFAIIDNAACAIVPFDMTKFKLQNLFFCACYCLVAFGAIFTTSI